MKIVVDASEISAAAEDFRRAARDFRKVLAAELQTFGNEAVEHLQTQVKGNLLGLPPKRRDNGKPPLIDSEKYINGYLAVVEGDGRTLGIYSQGMNDHMTNVALGELLEYGQGAIPARPHLRPLFAWMEGRANVLGERIVRGLFGGS